MAEPGSTELGRGVAAREPLGLDDGDGGRLRVGLLELAGEAGPIRSKGLVSVTELNGNGNAPPEAKDGEGCSYQTTRRRMVEKLMPDAYDGYGFLKPTTAPRLTRWCGFDAASSGIDDRPGILETTVVE